MWRPSLAAVVAAGFLRILRLTPSGQRFLFAAGEAKNPAIHTAILAAGWLRACLRPLWSLRFSGVSKGGLTFCEGGKSEPIFGKGMRRSTFQ